MEQNRRQDTRDQARLWVAVALAVLLLCSGNVSIAAPLEQQQQQQQQQQLDLQAAYESPYGQWVGAVSQALGAMHLYTFNSWFMKAFWPPPDRVLIESTAEPRKNSLKAKAFSKIRNRFQR